MDFDTAYYIIHHFPRLLTKTERAALREHYSMAKIGPPEKYDSIEAYEEKLKWFKEHIQISADSKALELLTNGINNFYIDAATRILEQTPDKIFFNHCPNCGRLARTPYAKQCKHCGHDWHDLIAAEFMVKNIFSLNRKPNTLYFAGEIKRGNITPGMNLDLTFLGVGIKPSIQAIDYIDCRSEQSTDVALEILVDSIDDCEYLRNSGGLAIPLIVEKQNAS